MKFAPAPPTNAIAVNMSRRSDEDAQDANNGEHCPRGAESGRRRSQSWMLRCRAGSCEGERKDRDADRGKQGHLRR